MTLPMTLPRFLVLILTALILSSCTTSQCSNVPQRPEAEPNASPTPSLESTPMTTPEGEDKSKRLPSANVFKNTGELQCGAGKPISLEDMQATLIRNKVTVYEGRTQPDGLMHMALCGSPSGKIHVYTIPKRDLTKAQKLGFKVLKDDKK